MVLSWFCVYSSKVRKTNMRDAFYLAKKHNVWAITETSMLETTS